MQRGSEWVIINKVQHEAGSGKLFSSATSFINWSDVIFNFSDINVGGRRTIIPVAASTGVYHEHGGGRLHPDNYDFSKGLTGWSAVGDFTASIDNRQIDGFQTQGGQAGYFPIYGAATENSYLVNYNQYERNVNPKYLESEEITIPYNGNGAIEVEVDVNATGPLTYPGSSFAPATLRISVVAVSGTEILTLDHSGKFIPMPSTNPPIFSKDFGKALPVNDVYKADSIGMKVKGTLEVGSLENYKLKVRIYGGTGGRTILVNMVSLSMKNTQEIPKGTIFKTERGSNFTKEHEIETTVFGDYITSGLNGYFYSYPIDDTSSIYNSTNELTSRWTAYNDPEQLPLLQHITRQRSRLFSVAHDLLSAELEVDDFDPLAIFVACGKRHTVVSGRFDFFRSTLSVELEEVAFQSANVRDFIYSYFGDGDGESGIKSIGGISGGSGGCGTGGGMTTEQLNALNEVVNEKHTHGNKQVLDEIKDIIKTGEEKEFSDENIMSSSRVINEIDNKIDDLDFDDKYLRKDIEDTAAGHITLNDGFTSKTHSFIEAPLDVDKKITAKEGLQIGTSFAGGFTGHGGMIDEVGNAELQSLILRTFLEVPELRFNRVDVIAGDLWNTKGAGIIEEVDTANQIITLKLEDGEIGRFRYDDIVMGIFHSFNDADNSVDDYDDGIGNRRFSGFATSYFKVTQILDADRYSKFRYELRTISPSYPRQFHPQPFMTCTAYGNFTNAERQTSMYQTTSYIRLLRNVNNWEFGIENIGMQWGDLSNLSIFGLDMTGYSAYMENVYFSGIIHQLSAKIKEQLDAQRVGGKNLLREYDIRFGFKYWGNAGEYTEFDINQIESTPQLQVQPNILNWTFPIRYGTVVITANGSWSITTPSWLNAYPIAGSGNKNVDLKAEEYKGRDARTGTVAVQSGVIQRNVSISQAGLAEFVTIDPILNVGYEAQTVTITGKSNSSKLTFTTDTGYLEINLPAQYNVNGTNVNNGSAIAGDPGALDEYNFSITVAVGENVEDFSIQNNIFATADGGQKAISTIVQRRTRIKVLADTDNSVISIGDIIFHIN
ncbi:MAG: BACON domain-containing protein [Petrimonas sp.]|nr:BACON domain-containing protein [Petrimonas sp.]